MASRLPRQLPQLLCLKLGMIRDECMVTIHILDDGMSRAQGDDEQVTTSDFLGGCEGGENMFKVCTNWSGLLCARHHCESKISERQKMQLSTGLYYVGIDSRGGRGAIYITSAQVSALSLIEYSRYIVYQKTVSIEVAVHHSRYLGCASVKFFAMRSWSESRTTVPPRCP